MNLTPLLLTALLFLLFYIPTHAQQREYKITLTFFSEKGERFWVVINGVRQHETAQQNTKIPNLVGNAWKAQIVFENQNLPEIGKSIFIPTAPTRDAELVYQIKRNRKGAYQVRLFSSTGFPNPMVEIVKGAGGLFRIPNIPIELPIPNYPQNNPNPQSPTPRQHACNAVMSEQNFDSLKDNIAAQSFEETKENTAKQAINYFCISTAQARTLLKLFSFEQTKLDFAKWVYDYAYDREHFYQVNDVFDFSMSVDELQAYIKTKR